jgi:hypothetical protein
MGLYTLLNLVRWMKKNKYDFIILYRKQEIVLIVGNAQKTWFKQWKTGVLSPSKFLTKVFDAGLHGQKTMTKFLIENFDRVNRALHIT